MLSPLWNVTQKIISINRAIDAGLPIVYKHFPPFMNKKCLSSIISLLTVAIDGYAYHLHSCSCSNVFLLFLFCSFIVA